MSRVKAHASAMKVREEVRARYAWPLVHAGVCR